jgi:hypothetical protein
MAMIAITTSNSINVKPRLKPLTLEGDILNNFFIDYLARPLIFPLFGVNLEYTYKKGMRLKNVKTRKKTKL